jgi:hypothetical protein
MKKKFRVSVLSLIKQGLNMLGQRPEDVLCYIEESLYPSEVKPVLAYIEYYCSDQNKEADQKKAYQNWLALDEKVKTVSGREPIPGWHKSNGTPFWK